MTKEEIELIEKDIENKLKAGECGLASNNEKFQWTNTANAMKKMLEENKQLKDKLCKIETLIINHNCDTGDIYYKYNSKFLKSELKQRILEIVYEEGSDSNAKD